METSTLEQAMVQSGVLPSSELNQQVVPSAGTTQVAPSQLQTQKTQNETQPSVDEQEYSENIQSLIQQLLKQQQHQSGTSAQSQLNVAVTQSSTVAGQAKLPTALTGNQASLPVGVNTPQYSTVIPQSVLAGSPEGTTVSHAAVRTNKGTPKFVLPLLQTNPAVSQAVQVPLTSPQVLSQVSAPELNTLVPAVQPQSSVVTIDATTLQLLQSNPGSSLVIPQRQNQAASPQSPQFRTMAPVTTSNSGTQLITRLLTSGETSSGFTAGNQSNLVPTLPQQPVQTQIPVIVEKAITSDSASSEQLTQLTVSGTGAVSQQGKAVQGILQEFKTIPGIPQSGTLKYMTPVQQIAQPIKLGSQLKPRPMLSILGHQTGLSVSKSPTLSSHGSMVSLLTGKHQKDELSSFSEKVASMGGKSMIHTLMQSSRKPSDGSQQTSVLGMHQTPKSQQILPSQAKTVQESIPTTHQSVPRVQSMVAELKQLGSPSTQQPNFTVSQSVTQSMAQTYTLPGMQQIQQEMKQLMVPTVQQTVSTISQPMAHSVAQSYTYPTHASSSAIPTTVLALTESEEDSGSAQTTTTTN